MALLRRGTVRLPVFCDNPAQSQQQQQQQQATNGSDGGGGSSTTDTRRESKGMLVAEAILDDVRAWSADARRQRQLNDSLYAVVRAWRERLSTASRSPASSMAIVASAPLSNAGGTAAAAAANRCNGDGAACRHGALVSREYNIYGCTLTGRVFRNEHRYTNRAWEISDQVSTWIDSWRDRQAARAKAGVPAGAAGSRCGNASCVKSGGIVTISKVHPIYACEIHGVVHVCDPTGVYSGVPRECSAVSVSSEQEVQCLYSGRVVDRVMDPHCIERPRYGRMTTVDAADAMGGGGGGDDGVDAPDEDGLADKDYDTDNDHGYGDYGVDSDADDMHHGGGRPYNDDDDDEGEGGYDIDARGSDEDDDFGGGGGGEPDQTGSYDIERSMYVVDADGGHHRHDRRRDSTSSIVDHHLRYADAYAIDEGMYAEDHVGPHRVPTSPGSHVRERKRPSSAMATAAHVRRRSMALVKSGGGESGATVESSGTGSSLLSYTPNWYEDQKNQRSAIVAHHQERDAGVVSTTVATPTAFTGTAMTTATTTAKETLRFMSPKAHDDPRMTSALVRQASVKKRPRKMFVVSVDAADATALSSSDSATGGGGGGGGGANSQSSHTVMVSAANVTASGHAKRRSPAAIMSTALDANGVRDDNALRRVLHDDAAVVIHDVLFNTDERTRLYHAVTRRAESDALERVRTYYARCVKQSDLPVLARVDAMYDAQLNKYRLPTVTRSDRTRESLYRHTAVTLWWHMLDAQRARMNNNNNSNTEAAAPQISRAHYRQHVLSVLYLMQNGQRVSIGGQEHTLLERDEYLRLHLLDRELLCEIRSTASSTGTRIGASAASARHAANRQDQAPAAAAAAALSSEVGGGGGSGRGVRYQHSDITAGQKAIKNALRVMTDDEKRAMVESIRSPAQWTLPHV